jgi:hypothetical protein
MARTSLPPRSDPRWRRAPLAVGDGEIDYLPLIPPHLPTLTSRVAWLREGAQLILLEDGFPARLTAAGIVVHPMHGRYILEDLIRQYAARPSERLLAAILRTAAAIIGRAELRGTSRLMWYEGGAAGSLLGGQRYISGLPQAYYATLLARVATISGDVRFAQAADEFFAPLLTATRSGGVLYEGRPGPSLAMAPMEPRDWILNGWLSMLVSVGQFAAERPSPDAADLFAANVRTLIRMLPAFDAPEQRLSRYMLPGMLLLRLSFSTAIDGIVLSDLRVKIPDEPHEIAIPLRETSGWQPRVLPHDAVRGRGVAEIVPKFRGLRMMALLSRAPFPRSNRLHFQIKSPRPVTIGLTAYIGSYAPLKSATVDRTWIELATVKVAAGSRNVGVPLPYEPIDLFSYPTNFAHTFGGKHLNTYHGTHIVRLTQLAKMTGNRTLAFWARRWRDYVDEWPALPGYETFGCWTPEGDI